MKGYSPLAPRHRLLRFGKRRRPHSYSRFSPEKPKPYQTKSAEKISYGRNCTAAEPLDKRSKRLNHPRSERVKYLQNLYRALFGYYDRYVDSLTSNKDVDSHLDNKTESSQDRLSRRSRSRFRGIFNKGDGYFVDSRQPVQCHNKMSFSLGRPSTVKDDHLMGEVRCTNQNSTKTNNGSGDVIIVPTALCRDSKENRRCHKIHNTRISHTKRLSKIWNARDSDSRAVVCRLDLRSDEDGLTAFNNIKDRAVDNSDRQSEKNYNTNSGVSNRKGNVRKDTESEEGVNMFSYTDSNESSCTSDDEDRDCYEPRGKYPDEVCNKKKHRLRHRDKPYRCDLPDEFEFSRRQPIPDRYCVEEVTNTCRPDIEVSSVATSNDRQECVTSESDRCNCAKCEAKIRDDNRNKTLHKEARREYDEHCRNNSSYKYAGYDQASTSKRSRSMCDRKVIFGRTTRVRSRGISTRASSSDDTFHRRYRQMPAARPKVGKTSSQQSRTVQIAQSNDNKKPTLNRSASKDKQAKGGGKGNAGDTKSSGAASKAASGTSLSKSSIPIPLGKSRSQGRVESKLRMGGFITDGIVPLTPEQICERCRKYSMDKDLGECVPLDFSHVQQLEKLAELVQDESLSQLLKTVTSIIEEKVCKQMFRCMLPCSCPGCIGRPNFCDNIGTKPQEPITKVEKSKSDKNVKKGGKGKGAKKKSSSGKMAPQSPAPRSPAPKSPAPRSPRPKSPAPEEKAEGVNGENSAQSPSANKCVSPSMPCFRRPTTCYYDRDCCYGSRYYTPRWRPYWDSSLRSGWWAGATQRPRYTPYESCWTSSNYENPCTSCYQPCTTCQQPYSAEGNAPVAPMKSESKVQFSKTNNVMRSPSTGDNSQRNKSNHWSATQEPNTERSTSMLEFMQRYNNDSFTPCPHVGIPPISKNLDHYRGLATPNLTANHYNSSNVKERENTKVSCIERRPPWDSSTCVRDRSSSRNSKDRYLAQARTLPQVGNETLRQHDTPAGDVNYAHVEQGESHSRSQLSTTECPSPTKRLQCLSPTKRLQNQNLTSPTTAAIGELEARTKELLAETKFGALDTYNNYKPASNYNMFGFSPIKPPDVNTAYSTRHTGVAGANGQDFSDNKQASQLPPNDDEKQWWDSTTASGAARSFNPVVFKTYTSNSAMPVSVKSINSNLAVDQSTDTKPPSVPGRSSSEPRPPASGPNKRRSRTPKSHQQLTSNETAKNSGSYTVCKGRPSRSMAKKSSKKLWKY